MHTRVNNGKEEENGWTTHDHDVERDHRQALGHVRLRVARHPVHEEACAQQHPDLEVVCPQPCRVSPSLHPRSHGPKYSPKRRCIGRSVHQPSNTRNGIHQRVNWMLRSIGRPCANSDAHGISGTTLKIDQDPPEPSPSSSSSGASTGLADSTSVSTCSDFTSSASASRLSWVAERELVAIALEAVGDRTVIAGGWCARAVVVLVPRVCLGPSGLSLFACGSCKTSSIASGSATNPIWKTSRSSVGPPFGFADLESCCEGWWRCANFPGWWRSLRDFRDLGLRTF